MPYGQGTTGSGGYYDSASGQNIDPNYGKGQMPGEVDPEDPYEVASHERRWIDQAAGSADEFSQNYYQQVADGGGYGEAMLNKGLGQAQSAMQSQAVSRGANPMAERAAILSGGQMMRKGAVDASGIRAQEMAMAAQQRQSQLNQAVAVQQWHEQMERQRQMSDQQHYAQMSGIEAGEDQYQAQLAMQGVGMGMQAAGGAGMASDIKLKDGSCVPADSLTDDALANLAEPEPAYHGVVIDDGQGPTRYTSRFGTAGNSPLKDLGPRDADPVLPAGGGAIAAYRPTEHAGPVNGTPQTLALNPDVERVIVGGDPLAELGRLQASYAATDSAGSGGGGMGAGGIVGAVMSDIRLKDGSCIPDPASRGRAVSAMGGMGSPYGGGYMGGGPYASPSGMAQRGSPPPGIMPRGSLPPGIRPGVQYGQVPQMQSSTGMRQKSGAPLVANSANQSYNVAQKYGQDAVASDIRLKDGTCIPRGDVVGGQVQALSAALDRAGADTDRQMGWAPSSGDEQARAIYAQLAAEGARTDAQLDRTGSHLQPKTWTYKSEAQRALGLPGGKRVGPMAQDLERSELGKLAVMETPAGKAIDRDAALGLSLGLHGRHGERDDEIDRRVSALEAALRREGKRTESKL